MLIKCVPAFFKLADEIHFQWFSGLQKPWFACTFLGMILTSFFDCKLVVMYMYTCIVIHHNKRWVNRSVAPFQPTWFRLQRVQTFAPPGPLWLVLLVPCFSYTYVTHKYIVNKLYWSYIICKCKCIILQAYANIILKPSSHASGRCSLEYGKIYTKNSCMYASGHEDWALSCAIGFYKFSLRQVGIK